MGRYDHRVHAGNAGDVWKHFLLLEAADYHLETGGSLVYAESHAGRPEYILRAPGDWEGGIGKIWQLLPSLGNFSYFSILADLNPKSASLVPPSYIYPGSIRLICELARRKGAYLQARVWDNDADVAGSWESFFAAERYTGSSPSVGIVFHQGDGFVEVISWLCRSPPGLLFIDPAYIDPEDARLADRLLQRAKDLGWIVLWWYMMDMQTAPEGLDKFELQFSEAGLYGGKWRGAVVAFAGGDSDRYDRLISHMHLQTKKFIRLLKR
jgi:23S rRNA (adenine2030-N6)-methyltransferase